MKKRKLAKIPREEASDEMVRFAERAAGTHIVTTKDIEKDLLMVTFYPIRKLKKGKKDAQLRTFFSKNDYISQDLTVEKVKWLTAAYDRMYDISLYEHHWDYKESTGRSVNDNTDAGLSNITNKMNTLATAAQKVNRILSSGFKTRGIEQTAERVDRTLGREHSIEVSADDNATPVLSRVEDAAERVGGISADIEIGANDNATAEISGVEDAAATLDGASADVELGADDNATGVVNSVGDSLSVLNGNEAVVELTADDNATMQIMDVEDALAALNGEVAVASVEADDTATQIIRSAEDAVATFDGTSGTAELGADDNASPIIDDVMDKASAWDGSVFTATMSIVDAATAPMGAVLNAAKNPIAQGATFLGVSAGLADTVNTYKRVKVSGMKKQDYIVRSCIYNQVCVVGKKETIEIIRSEMKEMSLVLEDVAKDLKSEKPVISEPVLDSMTERYLAFLEAALWMLKGSSYLWEDKKDGRESNEGL